jgi:hypothetical protein
MYTEIYVNIDLVKGVSNQVLHVLKGLCRDIRIYSGSGIIMNLERVEQFEPKFLELTSGFGNRFRALFSDSSFYLPKTSVSNLSYNKLSDQWSLLGKGDLKNCNGEIEEFFTWIAIYSETEFMGYHRCQENNEPNLVYKADYVKKT